MRKTCTSQQDYEKKIRLPRKFILTVQVNFKEEHLIQAKKNIQKINLPYVYGKYEPKCVYLSIECEVSHAIGPLTRKGCADKLSYHDYARYSICLHSLFVLKKSTEAFVVN